MSHLCLDTDLAGRLGVDVSLVRAWADVGGPVAARDPHGRRLFDAYAFRVWVDQRAHEAEQARADEERRHRLARALVRRCGVPLDAAPRVMARLLRRDLRWLDRAARFWQARA